MEPSRKYSVIVYENEKGYNGDLLFGKHAFKWKVCQKELGFLPPGGLNLPDTRKEIMDEIEVKLIDMVSKAIEDFKQDVGTLRLSSGGRKAEIVSMLYPHRSINISEELEKVLEN